MKQFGGLTMVIVYQGTEEGAKGFVEEVGLDKRATKVIADADSSIARKYNALPCPRVFVLDSKGVTRYTNNHKDDSPPNASPAVIVSRIVSALEACRRQGTGNRGQGTGKKPVRRKRRSGVQVFRYSGIRASK